MVIFFLVLNKEEYLKEILEAFIELDIRGATIIDSVGMGRILTYEIPIFAGLRELMPGSRPFNKTIFSLINEKKIKPLTQAIEQIIGSLDEPGNGVVFTIRVDDVKGLAKEIE